MCSVVSNGKQGNYAWTIQMLEKQLPTSGFLETQYMSPSKSLFAISSAKDRGPQVGKNMAYLEFPTMSSKPSIYVAVNLCMSPKCNPGCL